MTRCHLQWPSFQHVQPTIQDLSVPSESPAFVSFLSPPLPPQYRPLHPPILACQNAKTQHRTQSQAQSPARDPTSCSHGPTQPSRHPSSPRITTNDLYAAPIAPLPSSSPRDPPPHLPSYSRLSRHAHCAPRPPPWLRSLPRSAPPTAMAPPLLGHHRQRKRSLLWAP